MHNEPFNEPASFGIPGLNFQAKVTKFGTNVGQVRLWRFCLTSHNSDLGPFLVKAAVGSAILRWLF